MLNNCTFQGRFAADPEMRTTQSGLTVASFRMAVDRDNVGQDGRRATDWLNFVAWRKTAEFVCQYFRNDGGEAPPPGYQQPPYQNQQPQQMGFATQSQRQQWQVAADHPGNVQVSQSFSQGSDDDFSVLDDADDLPF